MPRDSRLCDEPVKATRDAYGRKRYRVTHTYVVLWPDGVIKAGIAGDATRWGKFTARGARLVALFAFDRASHAIELETALDGILDSLGVPAFERKQDAEAHLGSGGGGYLECYRLPDLDRVVAVEEFLIARRSERV